MLLANALYSIPISLILTLFSFMNLAIVTLTDSMTSLRNWSSISSVLAKPIVPINFFRNVPPSEILKPYCPRAETFNGIWKYGSIMRSPPVPHNKFLLSSLLINQTSAVNVVSPPLGMFINFSKTGRLALESTCLPEVKESHSVPLLKKKAS